ncbi:competence type IV pilus major pilin ComGC [Lactiplantibacillus daoliensis]|uniref:Competence type IV pilus major pilin ComGC n=1 Tax=Lactiplantibacillus daoliensis TaxID=2559916 RepID=A0ABW1UHM1_9LACO|nr:competence type IV pilus major pilin ComGC [Lactiplantibacillus daoliensis]
MKKLKRFLLKTTAPRKGFTLIEMVIVLAIIALLMLIVVPNLNAQRERASAKQSEALQEIVYNQAEMYKSDHQDAKGDVSIDQLEAEKYLNKKQAAQAKDYHTTRPGQANDASGK